MRLDLFGKPIRKKSTYEETKIQIDFVGHIKKLMSYGVFRKWQLFVIHHSPNERKATPQAGKRLKDMGRLAGWHDLVIIWGNQYPPNIAFLETKDSKGKLSDSQIAFKAICDTIGIPCEEYRSVTEGLDWFKKWGILPNSV